MKLLKLTAMALAMTACAPNSQLFEVTHVIVNGDSAIEVWSANSFVRTDIEVTHDSIHFIEAVGPYNSMVRTESIAIDSLVLEITDSSLTIQQPDQITTYLLFDLDNRYE